MRSESDQKDGAEEGWRAVGPLLHRSLERRGAERRAVHIRQDRGHDSHRDRGWRDADRGTVRPRLLRLLRLRAAAVCRQLARLAML